MQKRLLVLSLAVFASLTQPAHSNVVDFVFGAGSFGRPSSPIADCRNIVQRFIQNTKASKDTTWKNRVVKERAGNFLNDKDLIDEIKHRDEKLGVVNSKFIKELDTRLYFSATGKVDQNGEIPLVDKDAKALVIYFHGSGTSKASGANFAGKMNALAKLGYASVSFDLPFHAEGSRNPALRNTKEFAEYVDKIVRSVRNEGQPVILVGHSFGPDIMGEYVTRYPFGADAVVMLSPGGFDDVTSKWFADKTVHMTKAFGDFEANNDGGQWAGQVTSARTWSNPKAKGRIDPTVANPKLKIYVISGSREEYIPGELDSEGLPTSKPRSYDVEKAFKSFFKNVDVIIEPNVGHYIFAHEDAQGMDVVLRSILRANGESLLDEKAIKKKYSETIQRSAVELFVLKYSRDLFFRDWVDAQAKAEKINPKEFIKAIVKNDDSKAALKLSKIYDELMKFRMDELVKHIKNTETWAPDFYQANAKEIELLGTKGYDGTRIQSKYFAYLEESKNPELAEHYQVSREVLLAKEMEIKKSLTDKVTRTPVTIVSTRYAKETNFKAFVTTLAAKDGKTADEYIAAIVAASDDKAAQDLMKAYELTRVKP